VAFDAGVAASAKGFAAALTGLDRLDAGGVTSSLDRLSGESQASLTTTALQAVHSFGDQIGLQGALARGSAREDQVAGASRVQLASLGGTSDDPVATIDRPWGVWASGYGQTRQLGGNGNTHQLDETVVGGAFGADYTFDRTPDHSLRIGAAVGYGGTNFSIDSGGGSAQVDRTQFALYSGYTLDHVYLDGAVGIGFGEGATRRNIALPGVPGVATGQPTDVSFLAQAEAGYDFDVGGVVITPLAGIQVATDIGDRFSESGGPQALSIASQSQSSVQSTFGGRLAVNLPGAVALDLQVGWAHEFAPTNRSINVGFISQPGNRFTIQGAQAVSDSAKLGLGLAHQFTERSNVYLRYDTELASNADSHAITGGFRLTW
jgi:fibronectin-binding autotransporter adhesin